MEDLIKELSAIGIVETIKDDYVFTLFMSRGTHDLSKSVFTIMELAMRHTNKKTVEVMKNDESFLLMVLKP